MATRSTSGSTCSAALFALVVLGCGGGQRADGIGQSFDASFAALDGGTIELSHYRGRAVVVHFFATWSLTAQADVAQLNEAQRAGGTDVVVIGVALDKEATRVLGAWRRAAKATYLLGVASDLIRDGASSLGKIRSVPTTWVLDRKGRLSRKIERPLARGELVRALADL